MESLEEKIRFIAGENCEIKDALVEFGKTMESHYEEQYKSTFEPVTFTAEEFNKKPAPVFREVDRNGMCLINHDRYKDRIFVLTSRERRKEAE